MMEIMMMESCDGDICDVSITRMCLIYPFLQRIKYDCDDGLSSWYS